MANWDTLGHGVIAEPTSRQAASHHPIQDFMSTFISCIWLVILHKK